MKLELFTVSIKDEETIDIQFNKDLLEIVTEEELIKEMGDKVNVLLPVAKDLISFLKSKI